MDEADLRNLYGAGYLHLDSPVRRIGSQNWFTVEEMFPDFDRISTPKKYSATFRPMKAATSFRNTLLVLFLIVLVVVWLTRFSQKMVRVQSSAPKSQTAY